MKNLIQKFTKLFLLTAILFICFSVNAQVGRTLKTNSTDKKECKSGYNGSVSYTKTVTTSSSGRFGSYANMKRTYQANIVIRDDGRQQGSASMSETGLNGSFNLTGKATAGVTETDSRLDASEKDDFCNVTIKGAGAKTRVRCESKSSRTMNASGNNENTNVFIGFRNGKFMTLSIGNLPKLEGTVSQDSSTTCSGGCSPVKPIGSSSSVQTFNQGEKQVSTDDNVITFDPASFNRLSGSWTRTSSDGKTVETFEWNLSRCSSPLEIANIRFEHKRVPNPNQWVGVDPLNGTVDGNIVKIKAKVFNNGGETVYPSVKFSEMKSGEELPNGTVSIAIKPGEARDVEYEWDTSGFAWDENRKNQSEREIKAEIEGDSKTQKIKILPKPVITVHGLWSNAAAWADWHTYLREAHSFAWEAFPVGEDPYVAKMSTGDHPGNYKPTNTIFQNAHELGKQIKFVREQKNAWHVDVVAHSMGGLISRQYINAFMAPVFDGKPEITHLVMLGTPNMGSPCADLVGNTFEFFGQNEMHAMRELRPSVAAEFNSRTTNRKGVKFSILIGYAIPQTCQADVRGDGVVPIMSARYNISDRDYVFRDHISLTDDVNFKRFVLPRIAIGPKKAQTENQTAWLENSDDERFADSQTDGYGFNKYFQKVSFRRNTEQKTFDETENITTREKVVLQAKQSKEIEIPIGENAKNGVLIIATPAVVATLTDANGTVLGKSEGGLEAMKNPFRIIFVDKKPSGNSMKLNLENFDTKETTVFVAGFANNSAVNSDFTIEAGKLNAAGIIPLVAKLKENNAPVLSAKITANLVGQETEISFFDDGKHNDGVANDGIYGATIEKLANGEYFIEAKAEVNNQTKFAVTSINIGSSSSTPTKSATKPKRKT